MPEPQPVQAQEFFAQLPAPWPDSMLREQVARRLEASRGCLVVLDDDPTGTQTVHDVWVLTRWEPDDLRQALAREESCFYILTNSRSLPLEAAQALNRQIAGRLAQAAGEAGRPISVVSRSDSTLRGHFPGETDALAEALSQAEGAAFDGLILAPAFPDGGRFTAGDVHWVQEGERLLPAAQTPYARDPAFGYQHSALPEWVAEKTGGRVPASEVVSVSLETLRQGGPEAVRRLLMAVRGAQVVAANAAADRDLEVLAAGAWQAEAAGKRFLFRTAASFVKAAGGIADRPLLTATELLAGRPVRGGGLIVFGSFVPKSSAQLQAVMALPHITAVELPVAAVLEPQTRPAAITTAAAELNSAFAAGQDALLYTSRGLVSGAGGVDSLAIGQRVSAALMETVQAIQAAPRYVIGKGGITSSDLATVGMQAREARVLGQVHAGVPAWRLGAESRWPGMPYIVFPGNVGEADTVARIVAGLR